MVRTNGEISRKVVWIDSCLRLNLSSWRCYLVLRLPQKSLNVNTECAAKSTRLYSLCDQPLVALIYFTFHLYIYIFYCFHINLFLIDYAFWKLCHIWLFLFESNVRSIIYRSNNGGKILLQLLIVIGW